MNLKALLPTRLEEQDGVLCIIASNGAKVCEIGLGYGTNNAKFRALGDYIVNAINSYENAMVIVQAMLPRLRAEHLGLVSKYAGTPFENDPAYQRAEAHYDMAKALADQDDLTKRKVMK